MTAPEGENNENGTDGGGEGSSATPATFTQDQLNKLLARQKSELEQRFRGPEFQTITEKAAQFDALTESSRSAEQALADYKAQVAERDNELAWRDTLLLRQEQAAKKGLDPKLWSRVQGETPEEIEADINDLLSSFTGRTKTPNLRSGASADGNLTAKERAAQALRSTRER